jgi:DNA polymerase IV
MTTVRSILHVDMDAFYAAVEQRDAPELRGKPVILAHTGPRGVVSTASYEARVFGVHSAMPTARAQKLCPQGIYIEPRINYYAAISAEIFDVFGQVTPEIEGLSLDEAFLDVTASLSLFGSARQIGEFIRTEVFKRVQLNCSVGIAHNKLLAKMASELCKPNGLLVLNSSEIHTRLDPLPVGKLYTIGRVATEKLAQIGIKTIAQLRLASAASVRVALGNHTEIAQQFAAGIDTRPVVADRAEKSIGAEHTFSADLDRLDLVRMWLMRLTEKITARLRAHRLSAHTITVKLRVPPFETCTRQATMRPGGANTDAIFQLADALLTQWWQAQKRPRLRLLGLSASRFEPPSTQEVSTVENNQPVRQADLFAPVLVEPVAMTIPLRPAISKRSTDQLKDSINDKFGALSLRRARALETKE